MLWSDFYYDFTEWAESTVRSRISSLEDIGSGDEVVDAIFDLSSEKLKVQLIMKAMRLKAKFSHEDFMNLEGELPYEVYEKLAAYAGFDASCPAVDESDLVWDDFYSEYCGWNEADALRRIGKLKNFGAADEVCDAVCGMPNRACEEAIYQKAVSSGVKFADEQLEEMGRVETDAKGFLDNFVIDEDIEELEKSVSILCDELDDLESSMRQKPRKGGMGFLAALLGVLSAHGKTDSKRDTGHCDGDCANCPPHYGYRYGRWYYGHGHRYGCQRGGNGGASGRTYRD